MIFKETNYRKILEHELRKRVEHNPQYTLRSFARDLGMAAPRISEILNGKQGLSVVTAEKISKKIGLTNYEQDYFLTLIEIEHARSKTKRDLAKLSLLRFNHQRDRKLEEDSWAFISEWHHLAIMELTKIRGFQSNYSWIAEKLAITKEQAKEACSRLIKLNILKEENGKMTVVDEDRVFSPSEVPSESVRNFHGTVMQKALFALRTQPIAKRNFTTLIFAIDEEQIAEMKKVILDFVCKLDNSMTTSKKKKKVYCFSSQLFSLMDESVQ